MCTHTYKLTSSEIVKALQIAESAKITTEHQGEEITKVSLEINGEQVVIQGQAIANCPSTNEEVNSFWRGLCCGLFLREGKINSVIQYIDDVQ